MSTKSIRFSLLSMMAGMNIGDVEEAAEIFGFEHPEWNENKDGGKAKKWLAEQILHHPKEVLSKLPASDLGMIQRIIEEDSAMGAYATHTYGIAAMLNVLYFRNEGMRDRYDLPDELRKSFAPYIDEVMGDVKIQTRMLMEETLIGMTNLYGRVTRGEFISRLEKDFAFDQDGDIRAFYGWLRENSALIRFDDWDDDSSDDEAVFYSPFMWDDLDDFDSHVRKNVKPKKFDRQTIKDAGSSPFPTFTDPYAVRLRNLLEHDFDIEGDDVKYTIFEIWWRVQHQEDGNFDESSYTDYILHNVMPKMKPISGGIDTLNRNLQVFMDYCNHIPRWIFKGHSSAEMAKTR